jgi:hypothetical protein
MAATFSGIRLGRKTIEHSRASRPLIGVSAQLETFAQINAREPLNRVVLSDGLAAQLLKPEIADRQPYLSVLGPDFEWSVAIASDRIAAARKFADKVNAAAIKAEASRL